ncbi:TlpA disulfide reductase family protein [Pseudoalteromonas sp. T1lg65]|uniref:TlpA disulfide reductase family protein n=1 Tax=Pseudoalteromonas sp. T1lg65 TaxID=2077101 RepID=UPI003F796585
MRFKSVIASFCIAYYSMTTYASTSEQFVQTTTLNGEQINTQGKVTYLKFWATWCRYCVEEMPMLEQISNTANTDLQVLSINIGFNQSPQLVTRFLASHNYTFATAFDHTGDLSQQFDIVGTPTHILLDPQGNEIYRSALMNDELKKQLAPYLTTKGETHE